LRECNRAQSYVNLTGPPNRTHPRHREEAGQFVSA
jgi:hypothetical protein